MTATACHPLFLKKCSMDRVLKSTPEKRVSVKPLARQELMDTNQSLQGSNGACLVTSLAPNKGTKRSPGAFGIEIRPPSAKYSKTETHPHIGDVISLTSYTGSGTVDQEALSETPSPVVYDDIDPDASLINHENERQRFIYLSQHGTLPILLKSSTCFGHDLRPCSVDSGVLGQNGCNGLADVSTDVDTQGQVSVGDSIRHVTKGDRQYSSSPEQVYNGLDSSECFMSEFNHSHLFNGDEIVFDVQQLGNTCLASSGTDSGVSVVKKKRICSDKWIACIPKKWRRLLKRMQGFVMMLHPDLTISFVSSNVADYLGYTKNEMIGQSIAMFSHPSQHSVIEHNVRSLFPDHRDKSIADRALKCRHSFPVDMRFEFQRNERVLDTGHRTVQWLTRSIPTAGADNRGSDGAVFIICLPSPRLSQVPRLKELETPLGKQGRDILRLFLGGLRHRGFDHRDLIMTSPLMYCSSQVSNCLRYLQSLCNLPKPSSNARVWWDPAVVARCSSPYFKFVHRNTVGVSRSSKQANAFGNSPHVDKNNEKECLAEINDRHYQNHHAENSLHLNGKTAIHKRKRNHCRFFFKCSAGKPSSGRSIKTRYSGLSPAASPVSNVAPVRPSSIFTFRNSELPEQSDGTTESNDRQHHVGYQSTLSSSISNMAAQQDDDASTLPPPLEDENGHQMPDDPQPAHTMNEANQNDYRLSSLLQSLPQNEQTLSSHYIQSKEGRGSQDQDMTPLSYRSDFLSQNKNMGLEEMGLVTFHSSDVIMPVENDLDNFSDVTTSSSSTSVIDYISTSDSNDNEFFNSASSPCSIDCMQQHEVEPFDHLLHLSLSNDSPSPADVTKSNSSMTSSSHLMTPEVREGPNGLLMKIDDVIPQNKNPFQCPLGLRQCLSHCNSYPPSKESDAASQAKSHASSLLRSLLNVNQVQEVITSPLESRQPFFKQSAPPKRHPTHSYHKPQIASKTKELPLPKTCSSEQNTPSTIQEHLRTESHANAKYSSSDSSCQSTQSILIDIFKNDKSENSNTVCSPNQLENGVTDLETNVQSEEDRMCSNVLLNDSDTLPDDVVDLAMEYCSSLDNEGLISEMREKYDWGENLDFLNSPMPVDDLNQTPAQSQMFPHQNTLNTSGPVSTMVASKVAPRKSIPSVCLPISSKCISKPSTNAPITCSLSKSHPPPSTNLKTQVSLLRQAVTSPDVDKLIEQTPLGRKFLLTQHRSGEANKFSTVDKRCWPGITQSDSPHSLHSLLAFKRHERSFHQSPKYDKFSMKRQSTSCNSMTVHCGKAIKPCAISHISMSTPPDRSPKQSNISKPNTSSAKVKSSAPNDTNKTKSSPAKSASSCVPKTKSVCPNSSSEPVSVMFMRKDNHRSRKSKTIATQTDNSPDEVYPGLEMNPSDVIITPSVYIDTAQSRQSSPNGSNSTAHNCNMFSSSIRYLTHPRNSKELSVPSSPSSSRTSPSALSSPCLFEHLQGLSSPEGSLSCQRDESATSSDVPFLQRLLTGELSKDKYVKLDKDLLERQKSDSVSRLPDSQL